MFVIRQKKSGFRVVDKRGADDEEEPTTETTKEEAAVTEGTESKDAAQGEETATGDVGKTEMTEEEKEALREEVESWTPPGGRVEARPTWP